MQRLKSRISVTQDTSNTPPTPIDQEEEIATSDSGRATPSNFHYVNQMDEHEPLLSDTERVGELEIRRTPDVLANSRRGSSDQQERYYNISEIFEMGKMASLFFNKSGRILFYLCLTIYLYGDLAIYGAAVAKSLRDVACTYTPANVSKSSMNISEDDPCWEENSTINRIDAYRIALAVFIVAVGPFAFFNVTKTKYLQLLTTLMRWLAFVIMVRQLFFYKVGQLNFHPIYYIARGRS